MIIKIGSWDKSENAVVYISGAYKTSPHLSL
jgi:hypothetical protein